MKSYILLRHGKTQSNIERRYLGCGTDEPLCPQGIADLALCSAPAADRLFASPMKRCLQTAEILYPGMPATMIDDLRECDFGEFAGHNYEELKDKPAYQAWLDSGGMLAFPGGEDRRSFSRRCAAAFEAATAPLPEGRYAFVIHGGTIMSIMERFARPKGDYYDFQIKNGKGYILNEDGSYEVL